MSNVKPNRQSFTNNKKYCNYFFFQNICFLSALSWPTFVQNLSLFYKKRISLMTDQTDKKAPTYVSSLHVSINVLI